MVYCSILGSCRMLASVGSAQADDADALRKPSQGGDEESFGADALRCGDRPRGGIFFFVLSYVVCSCGGGTLHDAG